MTWPNGAIVPPFVRIDHVLTGAHLAVTGYRPSQDSAATTDT